MRIESSRMEIDNTVEFNYLVNELVGAWIAENRAAMDTINLKVTEICNSCITCDMNGRQLQLVIPSSFCNQLVIPSSFCNDLGKQEISDEVFLVTLLDSNADQVFQNAIIALNEKLERARISPTALMEALNLIFMALQKLQEKNSRPNLHIYTFATDAKTKCEAAKNSINSDATSAPADDVLKWCTVNPDPLCLAVNCCIQLAGIIDRDNAVLALGFSLSAPVKLTLGFSKSSWSFTGDSGSGSYLKPEKILAKQEVANSFQENTARKAFQDNLDEEIGYNQNDIQLQQYGLNVLLPELAWEYFYFLEKRASRDDTIVTKFIPSNAHLYSELEKYTADSNPFIGLLCFIGLRFKALPNWCIVCLRSLPYNVWRLQTCDSDFCLYRFEELGLGTPVLQEVQDCPEVIDFELSSASAAACSLRDVFEPFPAFLLQREELRGRSGWFSKAESQVNTIQGRHPLAFQMSSNNIYKAGHSHSIENDNKNLKLLQQILCCIPKVAEMQQYPDEAFLKKALSKFWKMELEMDRESVRGKMVEQVKNLLSKLWLPYDILRFVLSTNRSSLHLLQGDERLDFHNTVYQFAVLYGFPEREAEFEHHRSVQGGSFFAYHGSPSHNWFSILRNGIRCLSNTRYMRTGAAYGAGIYVAPSAFTSSRYCEMSPGWDHGLLKYGFSVLAICEIVNNSISPHARSDIMVVLPEHENHVAIRYILVFGKLIDENCSISGTMLAGKTDLRLHFNNVKSSFLAKQQEKWNIHKQEIFKAQSTASISKKREPEAELAPQLVVKKTHALASNHLASSGVQRLLNEYKNIVKEIKEVENKKSLEKGHSLPFLAGIEIHIPDESNICRWRVSLSKELFLDYPLYKDLIECGRLWKLSNLGIELECTFPDSYPFSPPFVRVVTPKFKFHTGHVTVGGSICMELLTESGWSPAFTFECVIVQIVNAMIEGDGRLDRNTWSSHAEYSELEAREAFERVAQAHGWKRR